MVESTLLPVQSMAFVAMVVPCTNSEALDIPSSICGKLSILRITTGVIKGATDIGANYNDGMLLHGISKEGFSKIVDHLDILLQPG